MSSALTAAQRLRITWYRLHWSCADVQGRPQLRSPAVLAGEGRIVFEGGVVLGFAPSPGYLSGYTHLEARNPGSEIVLRDGVHLNNVVTIVSEGPGVALGRRTVVGPGVHVYDSDFHALDPAERHGGTPRTGRVEIGDDVFLGTGCIVLRGVTVGAGSVVGAGAVVTRDVPPGSVVAGNPARVLSGPPG
ncbi:MAG: hypothetical protein JW895_17375 [Thermoleophilaceae bacterium]|nr:hypothetical protein [Thermoleophilaceae bacterium]